MDIISAGWDKIAYLISFWTLLKCKVNKEQFETKMLIIDLMDMNIICTLMIILNFNKLIL